MLECKQSQIPQFFPNSRAINSGCSDLICPIFTDNSDSFDPIRSIIELIRDLMVIYILTKFGADWLLFVDARV